MKKFIYIGLLMLLTGPWCYSQQGFGIGTSTPDPRAILELKSASQGLLLTRVADTNAISGGGVAGLLIYSMQDSKYYVHNGSSWKQLSFCGVGSTGGSSFLSGLPGGKGARPAPQAILELRSSNRGLLLPRVTDTNAITGGGIAGLLIYATKDHFVYLHNGTAWMQLCYGNGGGTPGGIGSITNCPGTVGGTLTGGVSASGVTLTLNYSGGNGGSFAAMNVVSTGVTGLTARLTAGSFANGSGSLAFAITGTPASSGTAFFPVTIGGQVCVMQVAVAAPVPTVSSFTNCPGAASGSFTQGMVGNGSITLGYSGGNGGAYAAMNVASTGVGGLTARLAAGNFANGSGSLVFSISGTPTGSGTAYFPITVGGQSCTMRIGVIAPAPPVVTGVSLNGNFNKFTYGDDIPPLIINVGSPLTAVYGDPSGIVSTSRSIFIWYSASRPFTHPTEIRRCQGCNVYYPTSADAGNMISVGMIPVSTSGVSSTQTYGSGNVYVHRP
jgi:hypothetical protein